MALITRTKKKKREREQKIHDEYNKLIAKPGNMKGACEMVIMKKFGLKARSSVYNIVKRVKDRNNSQQGQPDRFVFKSGECSQI